MIKSENKRIQLTLDPESINILTTICLRFNITKTQAIKQALKVFAAKRKHQITVIYREPDIYQEQEIAGKKNESSNEMTTEDIEEWKEALRNLGYSEQEIENTFQEKQNK